LQSNRAIFLDRDNTLIENAGYLGDPAGVKILPGTADAIAALRALNFRLVLVSNQAGVARGYYTEADVESVNREMCRLLALENPAALIDASYFCPFHPEAPLPKYRQSHDWRKPNCGMLKQAALDLSLDLAQSWMIGDQLRDVSAGKKAGCRTILLKDPALQAALDDPKIKDQPDFVAITLLEAVAIVERGLV